ncbi:MAG: TetR family transcriptional regulator [Chloroflexi bacterium]|nr:TetR family transcriptional regulator [Chloroflexota bacterium]
MVHSPSAMPHERMRDAERTRGEILEVATAEFAEHGYSGARVDDMADRMRTTKRMIYYYFGGKEQLYIAVLERAYAQLRDAEQTLDVEHLDPVTAVRELSELTFDHHERHPDFLRLVAIENIHRAEHIAKSDVLTSMNTRAVDLIARILRRGQEQGIFRRGVDPLDVHMLISAFCVFRVANKHTFKAIFGRDLSERSRRPHYRKMLGDVVVAYLTTAAEPISRTRRTTSRTPAQS